MSSFYSPRAPHLSAQDSRRQAMQAQPAARAMSPMSQTPSFGMMGAPLDKHALPTVPRGVGGSGMFHGADDALWNVSGAAFNQHAQQSNAGRQQLEYNLDNEAINHKMGMNAALAGQPAPAFGSYVGGAHPTGGQLAAYGKAFPSSQPSPMKPGGLLAGTGVRPQPAANWTPWLGAGAAETGGLASMGFHVQPQVPATPSAPQVPAQATAFRQRTDAKDAAAGAAVQDWHPAGPPQVFGNLRDRARVAARQPAPGGPGANQGVAMPGAPPQPAVPQQPATPGAAIMASARQRANFYASRGDKANAYAIMGDATEHAQEADRQHALQQAHLDKNVADIEEARARSEAARSSGRESDARAGAIKDQNEGGLFMKGLYERWASGNMSTDEYKSEVAKFWDSQRRAGVQPPVRPQVPSAPTTPPAPGAPAAMSSPAGPVAGGTPDDAVDSLAALLGDRNRPGLFPGFSDAMGAISGQRPASPGAAYDALQSSGADLSNPESPIGRAVRRQFAQMYGPSAIADEAGNDWNWFFPVTPEQQRKALFFRGQMPSAPPKTQMGLIPRMMFW